MGGSIHFTLFVYGFFFRPNTSQYPTLPSLGKAPGVVYLAPALVSLSQWMGTVTCFLRAG